MKPRESTSSAVTHKERDVLVGEKLLLVRAHELTVVAAGGMLVLVRTHGGTAIIVEVVFMLA